jgi:hypothetical protein
MEDFLNNQQIPLVRVIDPNTGQEYYSPAATVYDDRNGPNPTILKNILVDQAATASYIDGRVDFATSASYAATASYLLGSIASASYALTSSFATRALSASYAANGGVTQLLAGPNISLSPTNGLGQVTVSATLSGSTIFNTATGSYGSFYDTTTQTNPVANIARSMSLNSTDITNGVSVSGSTNPFNTYIKTENAGVYDIQFSAQVDKTDGGSDDIVIWLRKNGIDLTDTATTLTLPTNNSKVVAAWNWFVTSANGDYYQIIWRSADTDLRLLAEPISADHPGIPSVIVTANRVDQFLSNTGSFSGSFIGAFTGSFSGSVAAPGATTQVVFNNGGVLGANSGFVYSGSNVGIGTSSPQSGFRLDVNGNTVTRGAFYVSSDIYFFGAANPNIRINGLRFTDLTTTTTQVNISAAGNLGIGIGTTSASSRLQVRGSGATSATTALRVENTNASASLVVLDNGNIGIGTSTPTFKLDIINNTADVLKLSSTGTTSLEAAIELFSPPSDTTTPARSGRIYTKFDGTSYNNSRLTLQSVAAGNVLIDTLTIKSGSVGIGTNTPTQKLTIATGSISLDNTYALKIKNPTGSELDMVTLNAGNSLFLGSAQKEIYLRAGNNNILYVTSSAVGIGTTTPSDNLTVIGSTALYAGQTTITGATSGSGTTLLVRNLANTPALTITNARSSSFTGNVDIAGDLSATNSSGTRKFQSGYYHDIHPEAANASIIPFYSNDLAYNTLRGGSVSASFGPGSTYTLNNSQIEALFDGSSNYCIMNPMELSGSATFTMTFPQSYLFSNIIGFSFGSTSWVARDFTVEILVTGSYVTLDTQTGYTAANYTKFFGYGVNAATGARITFSNFVSPTNGAGFRIAEIFLLNYNSQLGKAVFMGRDGGAVYKPIIIQSGSAAAPSYSSLTDTNTGIYFPAADTLGFVEGGTEVMRINSSGQVGIGTTSPTSRLSVVDSSGYSPSLNATASANFNVSRGVAGATDLVFTLSGSSPFTAAIQHRHAALNGLSYSISLNPLGGNVGIGTNSPSTTLNVNGTTFLQGGQTTVRGSGTTSATTALRVENTNASASLVVLNDGNIGINTSTPTTKLAIQSVGVYSIFADSGNSTPGGNNPWLAIYNSSSISAATYGWGWYDSVVDGSLSLWRRNFSTTGSLVLSFSRDNGNVGIGKTLPNAKLDINGNAIITGSLTVTGGITGSLLGTASYATQALSASWAPGGGASFPYTGSAEITGSLSITGSLTVNNGTSTVLDTSINRLYDNSEIPSLDWNSRILYEPSGNTALLYDVPNSGYSLLSAYYYLSLKRPAVQDRFSSYPQNVSGQVNYDGDVIGGDLHGSVALHDLVYLDTNGAWYPISQSLDSCTKLIGICVDVDNSYILLEGSLTISSNIATSDSPYVQSLAHGRPIYIKNDTGSMMSTVIPSTPGNYVRVLGHAYYQNPSSTDYWIMKFRPSNDWIQI